MATLHTTLGPLTRNQTGRMLPHEHLFVDLRTWREPGYGEAEASEVISLMTPYIEEIQRQHVSVLVDAAGMGVGRRADILRALSQATGLPVLVPTGCYREPWLLPSIRDASVESNRDLFVRELNDQIESAGVQAGWIKIGATDDGMTESEQRLLHAAVLASLETGAIVGSHTVRGAVAKSQVDLIESVGGRLDRFIWIHTQHEHDVAVHLELGRRGIWLEYDTIGNPDQDAFFLDRIERILDAGLGEQLLLSHDRGWFDPAKPGGGTPKPFTYLFDVFVHKMAERRIDDSTIRMLTEENPFRAFSR